MRVVDVADLPRSVLRYGVGLWRRRWSVVIVAWLTALFVWACIWLLPDQFESRAQVFVQTETILDPVMSGVTARPNYERRVEVMTLQLLTRPNVEHVIYRSGLDKEIRAGSEIERQAKLQQTIDTVAGKIKIESPHEMYFIIRYRHGDPTIARNVVDALLNLLIEQDLGASLTESQEARRRLEREIAQLEVRLTAKEQEVVSFRRTNAGDLAVVLGNVRQREQKEQDLARVDDDLSLAERRVLTLENMLSSTARTSSGGELDRLLVELAALRSQYQDTHPDIRAVQSRINELTGPGGATLPSNPEFIRTRNELNSARDTAASLRQRRETLQRDLAALELSIGAAPAVEAELQRLEREYEQQRRNFEELQQRRDRLSLTESLGAGGKGVDYQVFERPQAAIMPVSPPRLLLIAAGLLVALGAGVGFAALQTLLQKSFSHSAELKDAFGLPVLGALSEVGSPSLAANRRKDFLRLSGALGALMLVGGVYTWFEVFRLPPSIDGAQSADVSLSRPASAAAASRDVR